MAGTKTAGVTSTTTAVLEASLDQLKATLAELQHEHTSAYNTWTSTQNTMGEIRSRISDIEGELLARRSPFKKGDIVLDDQGVRYRVHAVHTTETYTGKRAVAKAGTVYGIRLTKSGTEAYAKAREIVSSKPLTKAAE